VGGRLNIARGIRISCFDDANRGCSAFQIREAAEVRLSSCPGAQPIESAAPIS
jgi:hypothetical protein